MLECAECNEKNDDTWTYDYDPVTKQESLQWKLLVHCDQNWNRECASKPKGCWLFFLFLECCATLVYYKMWKSSVYKC
jgi:hypothetical protein